MLPSNYVSVHRTVGHFLAKELLESGADRSSHAYVKARITKPRQSAPKDEPDQTSTFMATMLGVIYDGRNKHCLSCHRRRTPSITRSQWLLR